MPDLFDIQLRAARRDRAARIGPELFLLERAFDDCLERIALMDRRFEHALLIGCPNPAWPKRLRSFSARVDVADPGPLFAAGVGVAPIVEDAWEPLPKSLDLVLALGTLDTVNDLPLALQLIRYGMRSGALLIGAVAGGDSLPQLRSAMRAADALLGAAAPHVHPRIEPSALSSLLTDAGFVVPVVDVDRVSLSYPSLRRLVVDLRRMAGTNILTSRPPRLTRAQYDAAARAFVERGDGSRTVERIELLHFACWTPPEG